MLKPLTASEMREMDERAIHEFGIPSLLLMENAGRSVAELTAARVKGRRIAVFCGRGNNGGDGLVAARHLNNRGFEVSVFLFDALETLKPDPSVNYRILQKMRIPVTVVTEPGLLEKGIAGIKNSDAVIDALFGVGLTRPVEGILKKTIEAIHQHASQVISVDVPSGLHSDTGEVMGAAVKASVTAALTAPKKGFFCGEGPKFVGEIRILDIGIPVSLIPT